LKAEKKKKTQKPTPRLWETRKEMSFKIRVKKGVKERAKKI